MYLQLVKGKAIFGYPWAVPQLFSDYLRILKDKCAPGLEWALHNPPKPHAFTSLPLQSSVTEDVRSSIADDVSRYEQKVEDIPTAEKLSNDNNDNPEEVRKASDRLLEEIKTDKENLLANIEQNKVNGNISPLTAEDLRCRVTDSAIVGERNIKETSNVAVEGIDDTSATEHLLYEYLLPLSLTSRPVLTIVSGLLKLCLDKDVKYLSSIYYNIHKNKIHSCCISVLLLVILLVVCYYSSVTYCDAPRAWGLYFQDSASPQMEALVELHDNIMYYLVAILFAVGWIQGAIIRNFDSSKSPISNKYLNHGTLIELVWTITPALILVLIAFPSFKLLYLMDEVTDPSLSVLAEGHQWYWSYEYPDFLNSDGDFVEFDSYLVPESDLEEGALRMLEVDNRVILPEITHTRFILTAADVIHSFAIPALGVKCDAYPGRLNQFSVLINRLGTFYGLSEQWPKL